MKEKILNEAAREMGRRGGKATAKKYGKDHMREIGRKGGKNSRKKVTA